MSKLAALADQILPATVLLSAVTLGIGIAACPLQSVALMHTFTGLSALTAIGVIASYYRHTSRKAPYERRFKVEFGLIPLALFWGALLYLCNDSLQGKVREASSRTQTFNNAKQIGLAMHGYHDSNKHLPTNIGDDKGNPILSWRAELLPYVDEMPLFHQLKRNKPWDDSANAALIEKVPFVYRSVFSFEPGKTPWQRFRGKGTAFEPGARLRLATDFPDGTSNTILCVEANQQVTWSKPEDIAYGPDLPLPTLGRPHTKRGPWPFCCPVPDSSRFIACFVDGTVRTFAVDMPEERLRQLIVRNDGAPPLGWED